MPHKDWSRAKGACRSFSRVQLSRFDMYPHSLAALRWCTKVWQHADMIAIYLSVVTLSGSNLCQVMELCASKLTEFCMKRLPDMSLEEWAWLDFIITKACTLQRLALCAPRVFTLPVIYQLRHLTLDVGKELSQQVCSSIEGLKTLEIISICSIKGRWYTSPGSYWLQQSQSCTLW